MTIEIQPPVYEHLRITIPAREALVRAGNVVRLTPAADIVEHIYGAARFDVELHAPCGGLVECLVGHGNEQHHCLRLDVEPEFPGEWSDGRGIAWHERGQWVACPECGAALVWYEAGYVPGYRICLNGHHCQLLSDGRSTKLMGRTTGRDNDELQRYRDALVHTRDAGIIALIDAVLGGDESQRGKLERALNRVDQDCPDEN
jgi:hypothetical protein